MITLTPDAARFIQRAMVRENLPADAALRLGLNREGCEENFTDYRYVLNFERHGVKADDTVFGSEGIRILVNHESLAYLDGLEIGVREKLGGQELTFLNPHARHSCGCGLTFSVEGSSPREKGVEAGRCRCIPAVPSH